MVKSIQHAAMMISLRRCEGMMANMSLLALHQARFKVGHVTWICQRSRPRMSQVPSPYAMPNPVSRNIVQLLSRLSNRLKLYLVRNLESLALL